MPRFNILSPLVSFFLFITAYAVFVPNSFAISGLHIVGNHFADSQGNIVVLRGASRWSLEFSCGDGHFNLSDFQAMASWGMNAVRIPLNTGYWQGNGCNQASYQNTVDQAVRNAEAAGLYVILVHQHVAGVSGNPPMAVAGDDVFWQQVSSKYGSDPNVGYVVVTEPHNVTWAEWYNGYNGGPGMKQLVDIIRSNAPHSIIIVNGLRWGDDVSFLTGQYAITGANIAYGAHIYGSWPTGLTQSLQSQYVIFADEFGYQNSGQLGNLSRVPSYFETNQTGYFAWAWHLPSGSNGGGMITNWNGTPASNWQGFHDFMLSASGGHLPQAQAVTPQAGSTALSLTLCPHGLATCGDLANPNGQGNFNPRHATRTVTIDVYNSLNTLAFSTQGSFTTANGVFSATVDLGNLATGQYTIFITMPHALVKKIGPIQITQGQVTTVSQTNLIVGDINADNTIDILDYNQLVSCFGNRQCADKQAADLNDDGVVDGVDYNILLREFSAGQGDEPRPASGIITGTIAPTSSSNSSSTTESHASTTDADHDNSSK